MGPGNRTGQSPAVQLEPDWLGIRAAAAETYVSLRAGGQTLHRLDTSTISYLHRPKALN